MSTGTALGIESAKRFQKWKQPFHFDWVADWIWQTSLSFGVLVPAVNEKDDWIRVSSAKVPSHRKVLCILLLLQQSFHCQVTLSQARHRFCWRWIVLARALCPDRVLCKSHVPLASIFNLTRMTRLYARQIADLSIEVNFLCHGWEHMHSRSST